MKKESHLHEPEESIEFYEARYEEGYMEQWPVEYKRKVFEVIRRIQLPQQGEVLDLGCGNGVLTDVIRQALPSWRVYGTDISKKAVANARLRYGECTFFEPDDPQFEGKKFDLLFTNHVFEHVYDVTEVLDRVKEYLKPTSHMLHFLPCGNEGSFEHGICLLRKDGINPDLGNRFFFEDEGHIRRLTSDGFAKMCRRIGFTLEKEFYSNQYHGAIEWITYSHPRLVLTFSDPSKAVDEEARKKLGKIRAKLLTIAALRLPAHVVELMLHKRNKTLLDYLLLLMGIPFLVFSTPVNNYYKRKARKEWETQKYNRSGSEMALYFRRD